MIDSESSISRLNDYQICELLMMFVFIKTDMRDIAIFYNGTSYRRGIIPQLLQRMWENTNDFSCVKTAVFIALDQSHAAYLERVGNGNE